MSSGGRWCHASWPASSIPGVGRVHSPFQQGAVLIDAPGAVAGTRSDCANLGLDLAAALAGTEHYAGPAFWDDRRRPGFALGTGAGDRPGRDWTLEPNLV